MPLSGPNTAKKSFTPTYFARGNHGVVERGAVLEAESWGLIPASLGIKKYPFPHPKP